MDRSIEFSESVYRLLAAIALDRDQTMTEVLRDENSRAAWLDDELRKENRLVLVRDGVTTELVAPRQAQLHQGGRPSRPE